MTPAQREQLNIFLFEQVMGRGWEALVPDYIEDWNSCQFLINKIERDGWEWSARKLKRIDSGAYYEFALTKTIDAHLIVARSVSRTEAICLAIALAYGWKEEV